MPLVNLAVLVLKSMLPICRNRQPQTTSHAARLCMGSTGTTHVQRARPAPKKSMARQQGERLTPQGCDTVTSSQRAFYLLHGKLGVNCNLMHKGARMHRRVSECQAHATARHTWPRHRTCSESIDACSDHAAGRWRRPRLHIWRSLRARNVRQYWTSSYLFSLHGPGAAYRI